MIVNFFVGQATAHFNPYCLDDMSQNVTSSINDFFYESPFLNCTLKFILSLLIDIGIVYTLLVWCLYSKNIRLITTLASYMVLNISCRFIHKTVQPAKSAFKVNYLPSIFVNYQDTTYSFFSVVMGILIICAFEWKRNGTYIYFIFFLALFFIESIVIVVLRGQFTHEVFSAGVSAHYLFIMNEFCLKKIFGKNYLENPEKKSKDNVDSLKKDFEKVRKFSDEEVNDNENETGKLNEKEDNMIDNRNGNLLQLKAQEVKRELEGI